MDTREEFENWAVEDGYNVSRNISDQYIYLYTNSAWNGWQHQQQKIDALKAEIEELKKSGGIMCPFKKLPKITFEEYVSSLPMPICGDRAEHYEWGLGLGMPCPMCVAKKQNEQKEIEEDRIARKVAMEVVRVLNIHDKESGDW